MVRPRVFAALVVLLFLTASNPSGADSCSECIMYPYKDSPFSDIDHQGNKLPVECADWCFSTETCIGFVISPNRDCWLKSNITSVGKFVAIPDRTIVITGDKNCQGLFSS